MDSAKLYEVRIHECAVTDGLFPRLERYRYTNMWQWEAYAGGTQWLRYGQGTWPFIEGKGYVRDYAAGGYAPAEIVGEIDQGRSMEADRFEVIG